MDKSNNKNEFTRSTDPTRPPQSEGKQKVDRAFLRPPNEDDDGYDPYSDRVVQESQWEEDPWR